MRKDGLQTAKDIRKSELITIRLDAEERAKIDENAEKWGISSSDAARRMMFRLIPKIASEYDVKKNASAALSTLSTEFPNCVSALSSISNSFLQSLVIKRPDGQPAVSDESVKRVMKQVQALLDKLHITVDDAIQKFDAVEFRNKGRKKVSREDMESARIRGKLASDPETFTNKDGEPFIKLVVAVNRGKDSVTYYNVFSRYDKTLTIFRKGQAVMVEGTMSLRRSVKDGVEQTKFSIWQDRVLLLDK